MREVTRGPPNAKDERFPGWKALVSLGFVVLSLIALALVPRLFDLRTRPLRTEVTDVIEPSRLLVARLEGLLAREVSLLRGYLLTGDERMLQQYHDLVLQEQAIHTQLAPFIGRLGPQIQQEFFGLQRDSRAWQTTVRDLNTLDTPEAIARELPRRQERFEQVLASAARLERSLYEKERARRGEIVAMADISRWITLGLLLLAGISVAIVAVLGIRLGHRTRTAGALARVSSTLTGALDVREILWLIAEQTQQLTRAGCVYAEWIDDAGEMVEVVAATGEGAPDPGTRVPYPGSLTQEILEHPEPHLLTDVKSVGQSMAPQLVETCSGCSALVVPLMADDDLMLGALVLLRRSRWRSFSQEDVTLARTLGYLASLASRKVLLIEEAQRRRAEVEELAQAKAKLMRGISHDLKNPISALDGYAELLEMGVKGELNSEQLRYLRRIRRAGNVMLDIIDGLLELARTEAQEIPVERRPTDVTQIARDTAEDYRASIKIAGLDLCVEVAADLPTVETDASRVRAIIGNLLSNALKYTPAGNRITVRAGLRSGGRAPGPGRWMTVDVEDTGYGIAPEDQAKIFEEFQRLAPDKAQGAGIGLSISRRIARLLGGDITVRSAPGEGSTFSLWLPCAPSETADG